MLYYILIIKKINIIKLIELFFIEITLKFNKLNSIIINRENIFINIF